MCFDQKTSFLFSILGAFSSYFIYKRTKNFYLTIGSFYFFLMEFLQVFQYHWINKCDSMVNKVLTILGLLHICFQPVFTHCIGRGLSRNKNIFEVYNVTFKLCILGGIFLFCRWAFFYIDFFKPINTEGYIHGYEANGTLKG
jgi:uncharacterized membrane protein